MTTGDNYRQSEQILTSLCPAVREIVAPLSNYLSIGFFRYIRSYPDKTKFVLCSDEKWLADYFKEKLYDVEYANYHKFPKIGGGISVHAACASDDPVCMFWNKRGSEAGYNHVLALYEKYDSYLEFYNFGIKEDSHAVNNIFLNNHSMFHHFILYFREHAQDLFKQAEKAKFICKETDYAEDIKNNWMLGLPEVYEKMIIEELPVTKIYLDGALSEVWITKEEAIYAKNRLNGFRSDQMSEKMKIPAAEVLAIENSLITKFKVPSERDLRMALINNRIQKKLTYIK